MSWVFGPGGGGTPGGANGDIQFNNNGSFSGSNLLTTDGSGSLSASTHVSASTFYGDGSNLTGVTASAVQVANGPQYSLQFRYDSPVSGDLSGSSDLLWDPATSDVLISGNVRLENGKEFYGDLEGAILFPAKVDEVGGIGKGKVVYIKGISGTTPTIGLAACDNPATMPAFGLCVASASNNANTQVATFGSLDGLNLNNISPGHSFSAGDILYVNTGSGGTAGTFTNIKPTGSNNLLQNIGKVVRNGVSSNGQIKVGGAGRTNDTPNLDKGYIFVGNETDQAIQDNTIFVSASANRVGINVSTNLSAALHVSASSVHGGESARFEGEVVITSPEGKLQVRDTTNNYQVSLAPAFIPRVAFGTTSNELQYMYIDGGNTNRIASLNDFYIATASVNGVNFGKGFYYDISEERFGIHTKTPTHDFTVNGDLSVSSSASGSINIGEGISYVFDGVNRFDVFENEFRINKTNFYQGVSGEQTSNFNIRDAQVFLVDTNSSVVTGTLPGVNSSDDYGVTFIIKDSGGNAGTNDIVIEPSGSQNIDGGAAAKITTNYGAMTVVAISSSTNGLGWAIVSAT